MASIADTSQQAAGELGPLGGFKFMAIPDNTYFGPNQNKIGQNYGDVRRQNTEEQLVSLELRLRDLLIKQIDELGRDDNDETKVFSPFPLAISTCVAIDALGEVFFKYDKKRTEKNQQYTFTSVLNKFDKSFSRPLPKQFKSGLSNLISDYKSENINSRSDLIYKTFRNSLMHGYKARAVYITQENIEWSENENDGYLIINPYWFWERFKLVFDKLFNDLKEAHEENNPYKISAHYYVKKLLE